MYSCVSEFLSMTIRNMSVARYGTWMLSRLNAGNALRVQPVLDMKNLLDNLDNYEESIAARKMNLGRPVASLPALYKEALDLRTSKDTLQTQREENTAAIGKIMRAQKLGKEPVLCVKTLKARGVEIRDRLKSATKEANVLNDDVMDYVLTLPNKLHSTTPRGAKNEILTEVTVPEGIKSWTPLERSEWSCNPEVGPAAEYLFGSAASTELDISAKVHSCLLDTGFVETGNVDFMESTVFDLAGIDARKFLKVREREATKSSATTDRTSYLVGGASFPAFVSLFAQTCIRNADAIMPIRYFVIGRNYTKDPTTSHIRQDTVAQVFVACKSELEAENEFQKLSDLTRKMLSECLGISHTVESVCAPDLENCEARRHVFRNNTSGKVVSNVSDIGDFVSKRLLCCYAAPNSHDGKFMHLLTGQFLNISELIRPER